MLCCAQKLRASIYTRSVLSYLVLRTSTAATEPASAILTPASASASRSWVVTCRPVPRHVCCVMYDLGLWRDFATVLPWPAAIRVPPLCDGTMVLQNVQRGLVNSMFAIAAPALDWSVHATPSIPFPSRSDRELQVCANRAKHQSVVLVGRLFR